MFEHRRRISAEHPRVLGLRARLQDLAKSRPAGYRRMAQAARDKFLPEYPGPSATGNKIISMALTSAVDKDNGLAREVVDLAFEFYIHKPILLGHAPHGSVTGICGLVYDLCHESWLPNERAEFHDYINRSWDANIDEETSPFHNAWYGYKNWGFGLACYATMYENPRAQEILRFIEQDYRERAAPCLKASGEGGGFGEGFYTHYWLYPWLFFCEAARLCEGVDYYQTVPEFYSQRAIAGLFEMYPALQERYTHCNIPMGDETGGRLCKRDRDLALGARSILANYYRDDPAHQAVSSFDTATPQAAFPDDAYMDFLWRDHSIPKVELSNFKLSHYSPGPGNVYARSSWKEDSAYLFFHCGKRFTAHQHLDQGHLLIARDDELLGDGGHYEWNTNHSINYYIRSIAHNTMLIYDPDEQFPSYIRAGGEGLNDGGQKYPWVGTVFRHNGAAMDFNDWLAHPELRDTGTILAYQDGGAYVYTAGDATKAYSAHKLECFTRQIVFIRPGTFIVFDRVKSTNKDYKKTCMWQTAKLPVGSDSKYVINNGPAKLFMQILLPEQPAVVMNHGPRLYQYRGHEVLPDNCEVRFRPEPECRMEVSPAIPSTVDYFLHVLTATDGLTNAVPDASVTCRSGKITAAVGSATVSFLKDTLGGRLELMSGDRRISVDLKNLE